MQTFISELCQQLALDPNNSNIIIKGQQQGLTNHNIHLQLNELDLILRLNNGNASKLGINRARELQILKALQPLNIAPHVIACGQQWLAYRYLPGAVLTDINDDQLALLAQHIQAYQALANTGTNTDDISRQLRLLQGNSSTLPSITQDILAYLNQQLGHCVMPVLLHCDLHAGNIVVNGNELMLLDWEFARYGDARLDIAAVVQNFALTPTQQRNWYHTFGLEERDCQEALACNQALSLLWYLSCELPPPPQLQLAAFNQRWAHLVA